MYFSALHIHNIMTNMYHDFSRVDLSELNHHSKRKMFPTLLHEFVSDHQNSHIITWLPHGRSFVLLKRDKFASHKSKSYFKLTKVKSFIRQLNGWGFHRVNKGVEKGAYYHEVRLLCFVGT